MRFFFDRNAPVRTARILAIYEGQNGHEVRHHDDNSRFDRNSKDTYILDSLYEEDPEWIFVGGDGKILKNKVELSVLADHNLTYLLFNKQWCGKGIEDTCWMLIKGWPKITAEMQRLKVHSIVELKFGHLGAIEVKGPTASYRMRQR